MVAPLFSVHDEDSDVSVSATNGSVSLDTVLNANILNSSEDYDIIAGRINGDFLAVDLSLNSALKGDIKKLDNGEFEVSLKVPDSLNGKSLVVYYIASDGTNETHEVTPVDGYAKFVTNHFSVYTLVEEGSLMDVPQTGDNIYAFIVLGLLSILGLVINKRVIRCN